MKYLLLLYFYFTSLSIYTQEDIDSTLIVLQRQDNTKDKVDKILSLCKKDYLNLHPRLIDKALNISGKIYYIEGIAKAFDLKGSKAKKQNDFKKAVEYHKRALGFIDKSDDTLTKINIIHNLAVSLRKLNFDKEAYGYYMQALNLAKKINNKSLIARLYNGIGNVYVDTENYEKALEFFKKSLNLEFKNKNLKGQDYNLANIGEVYLLMNNLDSAQIYLEKTLALEKLIYKPVDLGIIFNLMGQLYKRKNEYAKSIYFYDKALFSLKQKNIQRYIANSYINRGICKTKLKQFKKGLKDINKGKAIAIKIGSTENVFLGTLALSNFYNLQKNYKKALQYYKEATDYHNKVVNQNIKQSLVTTQIIYETQEKDNQIKQLAIEKKLEQKKSQKIQLRFIYTLIFSLLIIIFLYLFYKLKRKNSELKLAAKNTEIQNYIIQIKEMKNVLFDGTKSTKDLFKYKLHKLGLTNREVDVLKLIADGLNNDEIANKLFISKNTVKSHIKNIYVKLDVKNRIQAVKKIEGA